MTEDRLQNDFNEVENLTAVCKSNSSWPGEEYPELKIGETYHVTHIGVFRSSTIIILEEFGMKEYNSTCFDLYEGGKPLGILIRKKNDSLHLTLGRGIAKKSCSLRASRISASKGDNRIDQ